ncbi:MAG: DGQHR domain-containing protein [Sedimentisphaerales bacterium]|nr:DGQHR domain-containing protein [Sedimentisphaerales bacterium]
MGVTSKQPSRQQISVIVPKNPFLATALQQRLQCLCALDVEKLMEWWPGTPHSPHRNANKVRAIQRSLDWKRVAQIAAYLLQREIIDVPEKLNKYFRPIYEPKKNEPGREWPPRINRVIGFQRSEFPTFSNVLLHVNGATIEDTKEPGAANLIFDENDRNLNFSVIDGQHRINGAYFAVRLRQEENKDAQWEIPAEVFLDLDSTGDPPRKQAQIFIDVNFYQKKVDRSLVADLFPTARGTREPIDQKERAQDIGRKLMLETGPLVGMIQIPGIRFGVKDVITLATLNSAIEDVLDMMEKNGVNSLEMQTDFLAQCLTAWLEASGRFENKKRPERRDLTPQNVAYQGRILVSVIALIPAMIWKLRNEKTPLVSTKAESILIDWFKDMADRANLLEDGVFVAKDKFKERGYLGSGGIGRFRDSLWAVAAGSERLGRTKPEKVAQLADQSRKLIMSELGK